MWQFLAENWFLGQYWGCEFVSVWWKEHVMGSPTIHAAIPQDLAEWVDRREELRGGVASTSRAAVTELWVLRELLAQELARVRWSLEELGLMARSTMGTIPGPGVTGGVGVMFAALFDARRAGEVADDEATTALLERLGGLSVGADAALEFAVADWWAQGLDHTAEGWASVGVRVRDGQQA